MFVTSNINININLLIIFIIFIKSFILAFYLIPKIDLRKNGK